WRKNTRLFRIISLLSWENAIKSGMKESKWNVFLNVRLKTHQKRVIYYEKGYIKMKRENINPNNYHLFENDVISIKIEVKNKSFY
ncbi:hypothetical protein SD412_20995, partial [Bacteroides fragilis]